MIHQLKLENPDFQPLSQRPDDPPLEDISPHLVKEEEIRAIDKEIEVINRDIEKFQKLIKDHRSGINSKLKNKELEAFEKEKKRKVMEYLSEINTKQDQVGVILKQSGIHYFLINPISRG
jgi:hypothetical protein